MQIIGKAGDGANNYPLKGGKYSECDGGMRVVTFASRGYLPEKVQGIVNYELIHIADWVFDFFSFIWG